MKQLLLLLVIFWIAVPVVFSQGTVRGKITDENGEPLIGATVIIKSKPTTGTIADAEGKYTLKIPAGSQETILVSFIGYQSEEDTMVLRNNEVITRDFSLLPEAQEFNDVVVTAKAKKANNTYMQLIKGKSAVSIDFISAETIKRTGDSHATDAIKRITGVSTIGGYVSVRGLADRYIKTAVNGMRIPTLDPITNNIKLDIFPTSLVDNIVITKTASPDLPGDWAGSYVSIETKDYPDKLSVNWNTSVGYNPQTTFHEVTGSKRSNTDWLGYDNGYRDIYRAGYNGTYPAFYSEGGSSHMMLPYHEFTALGLQDYIRENGLTQRNLGLDSRNNLDYYYRLCLVELGLLAPGLIDNMEAVEAAATLYKDGYKNDAFRLVNTPASEFGQSMPNNWGSVRRKAPLNFSQEFSIGNQFELLGRPFGFLFGLRYASSLRNDPQASSNFAQSPEGDNTRYVHLYKNFESTAEADGWSALLNLAYSFSPNHNLSLLFMPNINGINYVREGETVNINASDSLTYNISQYYEERKQLVYQFHSSHYFPFLKLKVDLSASFTDGESSIPDSKSISFYPVEEHYVYRASDYNYKKSTYLFEDVVDTKLAAEFPLMEKPGLVRKVKLGAAYQRNNRESEIYKFILSAYPGENDIVIEDLSEINQVFSRDNFSIENSQHFIYDYSYDPINFVTGQSEIYAGYLMMDYAISPRFRASGGIRLEYTEMVTDVRLFHELNLPPDHPMREGATQGLVQLPSSRPGELDRYNYLPSFNIIYRVKSNEKVTINTRFNFSRSIARPSIREITPLYQEDFILQKDILGNPKLEIVEIDNYDLRAESYFNKGDNLSVSLFYKKFRNHIELVEVPYTTWENASLAEAYGIEVEGQKILSKHFDLKANITLIESFSKIFNYTHSMFGQAPYIINAILGYNSDRFKLSAALSYNVQGRKLALTSVRDSKLETSDIYEMPQHLVDFKISKTIGKHFSLSMKARNLLNTPLVRSYDYSKVGLIDYDRYSYGTEYLLTMTYNL